MTHRLWVITECHHRFMDSNKGWTLGTWVQYWGYFMCVGSENSVSFLLIFLTLQFCFFFNILVFLCMCIPRHACSSQSQLAGVGSLPPPYVFQGSNTNHWTWFSFTKLSLHPFSQFCCDLNTSKQWRYYYKICTIIWCCQRYIQMSPITKLQFCNSLESQFKN